LSERACKVVALNCAQTGDDTATPHYDEHVERRVFGALVDCITPDRLVALVGRGADAIAPFRPAAGKDKPVDAEAGSIRGLSPGGAQTACRLGSNGVRPSVRSRSSSPNR